MNQLKNIKTNFFNALITLFIINIICLLIAKGYAICLLEKIATKKDIE